MTLDELRAMFAGDAFATDVCGIVIDEADADGARCHMPLTPAHLNGNGVAQGGAVFTLCDTTFAVAANADGELTVSLGGNVTFVRPGSGACLMAEATKLSRGRTTCLYDVKVYDEQRALVAYATFNGYIKRH